MRHFIFGLLILTAVSFVTESVVAKPVAAELEPKFTVLSSKGGDHPPYTWFNEQKGREDGFIFRIQDEVFKDLKISIKRELLDFRSTQEWQQATAEVAAGHIDIVGGTTANLNMDGRLVLVPEPMIELEYHLLTLASNNKLVPLDRLDNLKLIMVGRSGGTFLNALFPTVHFTAFQSQQQAFQALLSGRYDGMLASYYSALAFTRYYGLSKKIIISDQVYASLPVYVAIAKTSPLLPRLSEINNKLIEMKELGRYKLILYQTMQQYLRQVSEANRYDNKSGMIEDSFSAPIPLKNNR